MRLDHLLSRERREMREHGAKPEVELFREGQKRRAAKSREPAKQAGRELTENSDKAYSSLYRFQGLRTHLDNCTERVERYEE